MGTTHSKKTQDVENLSKKHNFKGKHKDEIEKILNENGYYNINFCKGPYFTTYEYRVHVRIDEDNRVLSTYYQ